MYGIGMDGLFGAPRADWAICAHHKYYIVFDPSAPMLHLAEMCVLHRLGSELRLNPGYESG